MINARLDRMHARFVILRNVNSWLQYFYIGEVLGMLNGLKATH